MGDSLHEQLNERWRWDDLDPATRCVVAAFSGRVGDTSQGDISSWSFLGSMNEAFPEVDAKDVMKTATWTGFTGLHNVIVVRLSGEGNFETTRNVVAKVGELAGNTDAQNELADQAADVLAHGRPYDAIPALRVLSELAMQNYSADPLS